MSYQEIIIGNKGGDFVSIHPGLSSAEGWFDAVVHVRCEAFHGSSNASFMTGELCRFAEELRRLQTTLLGMAILDPLEPYLKVTFARDGKGHISASGEARSRLPGAGRYSQLEIDQTYLPAIVSTLSAWESAKAQHK